MLHCFHSSRRNTDDKRNNGCQIDPSKVTNHSLLRNQTTKFEQLTFIGKVRTEIKRERHIRFVLHCLTTTVLLVVFHKGSNVIVTETSQ